MNRRDFFQIGPDRGLVPLGLCLTAGLAVALAPAAARALAGVAPADAVPMGTFLGVVCCTEAGGTYDDGTKAKAHAAEGELLENFAVPPLLFESPDALLKRTHQGNDVVARVLGSNDDQLPSRIRDNSVLWKYDLLLGVHYAKSEGGQWLFTASLFRKDGHLLTEYTRTTVSELVAKLKSVLETTPLRETQQCADASANVICENLPQAIVGVPVDIHCWVDPPGGIRLVLRVKTPGALAFTVAPLAATTDGTALTQVTAKRAGDLSYYVLGYDGGAEPGTAPELCKMGYQPIHIESPPAGASENAGAPPPSDTAVEQASAPPETPAAPGAESGSRTPWPKSWNKMSCPEAQQSCRSTRIEPFTAGAYCLDEPEEQSVQADARRIYNELKNMVGLFDSTGRLTSVRKAAFVITGYASLGEHERSSQDLERYACPQPPAESGLPQIDNVYMLDPDLDRRLAFFRAESLYMSLLMLAIHDTPSPFTAWFPHIMNTAFMSSKGGMKEAERESDPSVGRAEVTAKVVGLQGAGRTRSVVEVILFDDAPAPGTTEHEGRVVRTEPAHADAPGAASGTQGINVLNVKVTVDATPPAPVTPVIDPAVLRAQRRPEHLMEWIGGAVGLSGLALTLTGSLIAGNATVANNNALYETGANNNQALGRSYDGFAVLGAGLVMTIVGAALVVSDLLERPPPPVSTTSSK